jgi:hypothetical protein
MPKFKKGDIVKYTGPTEEWRALTKMRVMSYRPGGENVKLMILEGRVEGTFGHLYVPGDEVVLINTRLSLAATTALEQIQHIIQAKFSEDHHGI